MLASTIRPLILPACLAAMPVLGCGGRSQLDALGFAGTGGLAGTGAGGGEGNGGHPVLIDDPCPAAVSGPKAMAGNCSTRDGRSRVPAPTAPHVTWTQKLPVDSSGQAGPSAIATDAHRHAYVVTEGELDESVAALRRVRAADGTIEWTEPIRPDEETSTPIVLAQGGVDIFAYDGQTTDSLFTFAPKTGASTSTTFGFSLYDAPGNLAVGTDGSLYVTHADGVGGAQQTTFVSRVGPDGAVLWTSVDLATLVPPDDVVEGEVFPSTIALGTGGLVVIEADVVGNTDDVATVIAFDATSGATRWSTQIVGQLAGGPVARKDGTIVVLIDQGGASQLVVLDPGSGAPTPTTLATGVFQIAAVTVDGAIIGGADEGNGVTGLVEYGSDGTMLWSGPGSGKATIANDGTVISFGAEITALDGKTGQMKWQLSPPNPGSCILDAALTSEGELVALQCDGTLFGASD